MSYDIRLVPAGTEEKVFDYNITYNLAPLFIDCLGKPNGLWSLTSLAGQEALELVLGALNRLLRDPVHYAGYDAPNGWGKSKDAVTFFVALAQACAEYPEAIVHIT